MTRVTHFHTCSQQLTRRCERLILCLDHDCQLSPSEEIVCQDCYHARDLYLEGIEHDRQVDRAIQMKRQAMKDTVRHEDG